MTSSLVGSEMCIRDRQQPQSFSIGFLRQPSETCSGERRCAEIADNDGPVSYTHLTLPTICSV
eukprot:3301126-Prorocentrum_lima.AAC.1